MNTKDLNKLLKSHLLLQKSAPQRIKNYIAVLRQTSLIYDSLTSLAVQMGHLAQHTTFTTKSSLSRETADELIFINQVLGVFETSRALAKAQQLSEFSAPARCVIISAVHGAINFLHNDFSKPFKELYSSMLNKHKNNSTQTDTIFTTLIIKYHQCQWFKQFLIILRQAWDKNHINMTKFNHIEQHANRYRHNNSLKAVSNYTNRLKRFGSRSYLAIFYDKTIALAHLRYKMYDHLCFEAGHVHSNPCIDNRLQSNLCQTLLRSIHIAIIDFKHFNQIDNKTLNSQCKFIDKLLEAWLRVIHYSLTTFKYDNYYYKIERKLYYEHKGTKPTD